ncbi:putative hydrolase [Colletotrichum aenigma]|uniref:putative hydrolase n=1 Tax=Colletotrichum aenigma TaxID=1215731 RepID=UPI001872F95A|nr:putative hydrolase [Colletotrichum aenigma]KAF5501858.1 putative hydrolase [Colletotrichum aenigma]
MKTRSFSVALLLLHGARANAASGGRQEIEWGACTEFNSTEPIQCANLTVPLDYTSPNSSKTLDLQLLRIPATRQPSKGSILFNFGGPGIAGRPTMAAAGAGEVYRNATSEHHDLVTFDPRGTGNTIPFSCFKDQDEIDDYVLRTPKAWAIMTPPNFSSNSSDVTPGRLWASSKLLVDKCYETSKEMAGVYGTAFVVRDMMQIVDALGEDGLLRYWGHSYGTILGQTAAAMFPDRIDRMVLDGNLNGHEYYNAWDDEQWASSDEAFSAVFQSCVARPSTCPLAHRNQTAQELEDATYALLNDLNARPIPFNGTWIDYNVVKESIMSALYNTAYWPVLTDALDALMSGNYTLFTENSAKLSSSYDSVGTRSDAQLQIRCGDKIARVDTLDDFLPIMDRQERGSKIFGDIQTTLEMMCAQWRLNAKERYAGDFAVKTRHPVMFIGNTADALGPLVSAKNMSVAFEGSRVLQVDGYGHGSVGTSKCAAMATADYYVNGTLPKEDAFCELDVPIL